MQQLHQDLGIQFTLIPNPKDERQHLLESEIDDFLDFVSRDGRSGKEIMHTAWIHALEGPNEYDKNPGDPEFGTITNGKPQWAWELIAFQKEYYRQIRNHSVAAIRNKIVLGPSFRYPDQARYMTHVGDLAAWMDFGSLHHYAGGKLPTHHLQPGADTKGRLVNMRIVSGDKNLYMTETGYHNALKATSGQPATSLTACAKYIPRIFADVLGENTLIKTTSTNWLI